MVWISFAMDCGYIEEKKAIELFDKYEEVGSLLGYMIEHPEKFQPKTK